MADTDAPATNGVHGDHSEPSNGNIITNGAVAKAVKTELSKTSQELKNLAASRKGPVKSAANGQALTNYHSYFASLLEWENPRASAIAYASIVTFIFAVRYLDILRWGFKLTWIALGITVAAEGAGKLVMGNGLMSQFRPRQYRTIPRETLEAMIGDVHELINFFVIEAQRILFAENLAASACAFFGTFVSYFLVKVVPVWGLALISTTMMFFVPLVYKSNQELIDAQIQQASDVVNAQTAQLREIAGKHTTQAAELTKQYMGDYTVKAQEMLRGKTPVKESDFPAAPKDEIKSEEPTEEEPLMS